MPPKTIQENVRDRFYQKVILPDDLNDCWIWQGAQTQHPYCSYGRFTWLNGKLIMAHHAAWYLSGRQIPPGKILMHTCDNPLCVNPDHLRIGTRQENVQDMLDKGREDHLKGMQKASSKLTDAQVRQIRALYSTGQLSQAELGEQFGVYQTTVSRIVRRTGWAHID